MNKIKNSVFFKIISVILIITFISLDLAYAYPPEHNPGNSTLATPSLMQQQPINEHIARFQQSVFSQGALLASVYDIGEYFFGRPERKMESLPSKYAKEVVEAGLGKILGDSGIEILNIVPVDYLKKTVPEKLNSALIEIGFKGNLPDEGVVFILYKKDDKKFLIQIAEKAKVSASNLPGYEWVISDKYVVKYISEGYRETISPLDAAKESPKVTITEPIMNIEVPASKAEETKSIFKRAINIRAITTLMLVVISMAPQIVLGASGDSTSYFSFSNIFHIVTNQSIAGFISAFLWLKEFAVAHPIITGAAVLGISKVIFFTIWRICSPVDYAKYEYSEQRSKKKKGDSKTGSFAVISGVACLIIAVCAMKDFAFAHPIIAVIAATGVFIAILGVTWQKHSKISRYMLKLKDDDPSIRLAATDELIKKGSTAVPSLIKALEDYRDYVRLSAAKALGEIKDPRAKEPLKKLLSDSSSDVSRIAAESLEKIESIAPKVVSQQTSQKAISFKDIQSKIEQELMLKKEVSPQELLILVLSIVPESMQNLTQALNELKLLSEQINDTVDARSAAIAPLKEKYKLSNSETKILRIALTGKSQDQNASPTIYSFNPFAFIFGTSATASILGDIKDFAFAHPIITGVAALSICTTAFFAIWRIRFPISWNIWRLGRSGNYYVRSAVVRTLGNTGDPRVVDPLIKALDDESYYVRADAAIALGNIKDPRAVEPLVKTLSDSSSHVRFTVTYALVNIGFPAVPYLIRALDNSSSRVRSAAAKALGDIGEPLLSSMDEYLKTMTNNAEYYVVLTKAEIAHIIDCLGKGFNIRASYVDYISHKETGPDTYDGHSLESTVIDSPARLIIKMDKTILQRGEKKSSATTLMSINSFATIFSIAALSSIFSAAKDLAFAYPIITLVASLAIGIKLALIAWRKSSPITYYMYALRPTAIFQNETDAKAALVKIGEQALHYLIESLKSKNSDSDSMRRAVIEVLGEIKSARAVEPLIDMLKSDNEKLCIDAAKVLGKIGDPLAVDPLIDILKSQKSLLSSHAALALGEIGDRRAVGPLIKTLNDNISWHGSISWIRTIEKAISNIGWKPKGQDEGIAYFVAIKRWDALVNMGTAAIPDIIRALSDKSFFEYDFDKIARNLRNISRAEWTEILSAELERTSDALKTRRLVAVLRKLDVPIMGRYGSIKVVESDRAKRPENANAVTQLFKLVESSFKDEKKSLDQLEVDGAVSSLIVLARSAKRENQKLIIGLETDWIPGIKVENSLQRQAITALIKEIDGIAGTLQSMGLDNVEIIRGSGDKLSSALLSEADKTHTNMHNIVVMASTMTINSDSFAPLRNADENDKPFLAGIDPTELVKLYAEFGESISKQLYIRLSGMLYLALELAAGKEPPQTPMIASYDRKLRIVIFLPRAEPMDYEALKRTYKAEKTALQAA